MRVQSTVSISRLISRDTSAVERARSPATVHAYVYLRDRFSRAKPNHAIIHSPLLEERVDIFSQGNDYREGFLGHNVTDFSVWPALNTEIAFPILRTVIPLATALDGIVPFVVSYQKNIKARSVRSEVLATESFS